MAAPVAFRITYQQYGELRDDLSQMGHGGLMVKVADAADLVLDAPISLELVLPDGTGLAAAGRVLHVFPGVGLAVSVPPELVDEVRRSSTGTDAGAGAAYHERVTDAPAAPRTRTSTATATAATSIDQLGHAEKIQVALHGTRDQRNAILRDQNRTLHAFVLKNPALTTEDVLAIAKNAQMTPEMLGQVAARKDWFQRPQIALALARNPKTPPEVGVRALDFVPMEALRQIAKGVGALPHVAAAARKKVLGNR